MQKWFSLRAGKLALGWAVVLACVAACGCWNTNTPRSPLNTRGPMGVPARTPEGAKNAAHNASPAGTSNNAGAATNLGNHTPSNPRISGNVPMDTSNRLGANAGLASPLNSGMPANISNPIQPANGVMPSANGHNGLTPIASNNVVSSPPVSLPVNISNAGALPAPDPTPADRVTPPVVSMQDQDPGFHRRVPPPIPASEVPPNLTPNSGIQTPPSSPIRSIK